MNQKQESAVREIFRTASLTAIHGKTVDSAVLEARDTVAAFGVTVPQVIDLFGEDSKIAEILARHEPDAAEIEFPATCLAHWTGDPTPSCDAHAAGMQKLGQIMGHNVILTALTEPRECINCRNEAKASADG